jgi:NAD(P)-dependent dehydrogenase (short-subunit alcohol dehydrogenase family)
MQKRARGDMGDDASVSSDLVSPCPDPDACRWNQRSWRDLLCENKSVRSFVVTGGARGVGRAVAERLTDDGYVVVLDRDAPAWTKHHPRITAVVGDASIEAVVDDAAEQAEQTGPLAGWVNNAAVFEDAWVHTTPASEVLKLVSTNLALALAGCTVAIRHFIAAQTEGAIVNVSSHQARRPVRGALPYATAKAAIEGLTKALAVDYGPVGIRTNAVALGSIATERYNTALRDRPDRGERTQELHPLGRVGHPREVAAEIAHLLSPEASFVNGAIVPIDGGRAALGLDPEARNLQI